MKCGNSERIWFLAPEPRLCKRKIVRLVKDPVGLCPNAQSLSITAWQRAPRIFFKKVLCRKIIECYAECADHTETSLVGYACPPAPAAAELNLVAGLFLNGVFNVNSTVRRIG